MESRMSMAASRIENDRGIEPNAPHVVFEVGRRWLGVPALHIKEAIKCSRLMLIRNSNPLVIGLMRYRRDFLPVFDLGRAFGEAEALLFEAKEMVIGEARGCMFGLLTDRVIDFAEIPEAAIIHRELNDREIGYNKFFRGLALFQRQSVLLVDLNYLLDWPQKNGLGLDELRKPWVNCPV